MPAPSALAVPPRISGRVPAGVNRVPPRGVARAALAASGVHRQQGAEPLGCFPLFGAAVVRAPLSVEARWNVSAVLVWACGVSSSLLGVRVIPLLESHLLG